MPGKNEKVLKKYRINLFEQMKRFWEIVDENQDITPVEIALYSFLLNLNNSLAWKEWFTVAVSEALGRVRFCEKTYYRALNKLDSLHLIERRKGHKNQTAQMKIVILKAVKFTDQETIKRQSKDNQKTINVPSFIDSKDSKDKKDYLDIAILFYNSELKKAKQEFEEFKANNPYNENGPPNLQPLYPDILKRGNRLRQYEELVNFLQKDNAYKRPFNLLSVPGQLTFEQFGRFCSNYNTKHKSFDENNKLDGRLRTMLGKIDNDPMYYKSKAELYGILVSWQEREEKTASSRYSVHPTT